MVTSRPILICLLLVAACGERTAKLVPAGIGLTSTLPIPDSALTSSGHRDGLTGPEQARLFSSTGSGAWVAAGDDPEVDQWLQVDLQTPRLIVKVETQGAAKASWWTTRYLVSHSLDGKQWTFYTPRNLDALTPKAFVGNWDRYRVTEHALETPFTARFVRFHPKRWQGRPALRVELWACSGPECQNFAKPSGIVAPVGISTRALLKIDDRALTCSDHLNPKPDPKDEKQFRDVQHHQKDEFKFEWDELSQISPLGKLVVPRLRDSSDQRYAAHQARLFNDAGGGGWAPSKAEPRHWLQVDLGNTPKYVHAVATQGREHAHQFVQKYELALGNSTADIDTVGEFEGNADGETPVTNRLAQPVLARFVRFYPLTWTGHPSLRVEVFACAAPNERCEEQAGVGVRSFLPVADADMTASSFEGAQSGTRFAAHNGRLRNSAGGGCWRAAIRRGAQERPAEPEWLQIRLPKQGFVAKVATQGAAHAKEWVKEYQLSFSTDGETWGLCCGGASHTFTGNSDPHEVVERELPVPVLARYVRFIPTSWKGLAPALRVEVYLTGDEAIVATGEDRTEL
eukprot:TRINITY_DN43101_c0_g1_i1.p1 TRINITY_DN43101_c0_g1~~TRINITY_DN43101_c0_g1_i1.p1  ORF type:complete len:579 (-),score=81.30 TRINITY_DN43101_c0_g1_i1:7-1716(-)